jgi:hypothetical protein
MHIPQAGHEVAALAIKTLDLGVKSQLCGCVCDGGDSPVFDQDLAVFSQATNWVDDVNVFDQ